MLTALLAITAVILPYVVVRVLAFPLWLLPAVIRGPIVLCLVVWGWLLMLFG